MPHIDEYYVKTTDKTAYVRQLCAEARDMCGQMIIFFKCKFIFLNRSWTVVVFVCYTQCNSNYSFLLSEKRNSTLQLRQPENWFQTRGFIYLWFDNTITKQSIERYSKWIHKIILATNLLARGVDVPNNVRLYWLKVYEELIFI